MQNIAGDICQPKIAAAVGIREPGVIDAHQMQDGRMEIVYVDRLFDGSIWVRGWWCW